MKKLRFSILAFCFFTLCCVTHFAEEKKEVISPPKKGYVTLSKKEYESLLKKLKLPKKEVMKPPQDFSIMMADYNITVDDDLKIRGTVSYHVESLSDKKWIKARLQNRSEGISFNTPPEGVLLTYQRGSVSFGTNLKRAFVLSADITRQMERDDLKTYRFIVQSSRAMINRLTVSIPSKKIKIRSNPLLKISSSQEGDFLRFTGLAWPDNDLEFKFSPVQIDDPSRMAERRMEVESSAFYSIESGLMRNSYHLRFTANKSGFTRSIIELPKMLDVYSVNGREVTGWDVQELGKKRQLEVDLDAAHAETIDLFIATEQTYGEKESELTLPFLIPMGADRIKATCAIAAGEKLELLTKSLKGAQEIDISDLPGKYSDLSSAKPVLAYKYWKDKNDTTPEIILSLKEYEHVAVLTANIENAYFTTLHTQKGKGFVSGSYWIRNNIKQNLKVKAPEGYRLWSCFVSGKPVKPTIDKDKSLLIPLKRSRDASVSVSFSVEVVFYYQQGAMQEEGILSLGLPVCDLQIMQLGWELLLPDNYEYDEDWTGNLEQVSREKFYSLNVTPWQSNTEKQSREFSFNQNALVNQFTLNQEQQQKIQQQADDLIKRFKKRERFSRIRSGKLPVRFQMLRVGKQFLFSKLLVLGKAPELHVEYELDD